MAIPLPQTRATSPPRATQRPLLPCRFIVKWHSKIIADGAQCARGKPRNNKLMRQHSMVFALQRGPFARPNFLEHA